MRKATTDCPDAETLAALADDTLPAAARREVEGHIADCDRCQALTAAMVRAEPLTGTPADVAADEVPAWRRRAFNWLVPAAAAATAVALWVLVPGQRTPLPEESVADRQIAATPPPRSSEVISSEPLQVPVDADADTTGRPAREGNASVGFERAAPAASPAAAPAERSLKTETPVTGGLASGAERRDEATQNEAVAVEERAFNQPAAPVAAARAADAAIARAAAGVEVVSPNPQIRWRGGPGPVVQYSADGGATWAAQPTGASTELTAGSAPAPAICWLVGRSGLVLRTTDGGRQWQRLAFPETVDLTAITASSALDATVVLADGRRFVTGDGGRTWAPIR